MFHNFGAICLELCNKSALSQRSQASVKRSSVGGFEIFLRRESLTAHAFSVYLELFKFNIFLSIMVCKINLESFAKYVANFNSAFCM